MTDRKEVERRAWAEAFRRWPDNGSVSHDRNMDRRRGGFVDGALWQVSPTDHTNGSQ